MSKPVEFSAYSALKGHIAYIETNDPEAAVSIATDIDARLDARYRSVPGANTPFFTESLTTDEYSRSETRPGVGDFAVSLAIASPYETKGLDPESDVYLVMADTRNSARDSGAEGAAQLQSAIEETLGDYLQ